MHPQAVYDGNPRARGSDDARSSSEEPWRLWRHLTYNLQSSI